tara:strand:+ start:776 stop:1174 length:399 start_codon:yes stop_codon:yes gene_type:complete
MNLNTLSVKNYDTIAITNAWDANRSKEIGIDVNGHQAIFTGNIQGVYINCDSIVTAKSITICITKDAAGDNIILPDTLASLSYGKTTVTNGAAVWKVDLDATITNKIVYLHFKTDAGTLNINKIKLVYRRLG